MIRPRPLVRAGRLGLLIVVVVAAAACGRRLPTEPLEEVPHPDLSTAEEAVRRQLTKARLDLDALLDAGAVSRKMTVEQAEAFGRLASLYQAYDQLDAAAASYRNASRLAPAEPRWPYLLGVVYRYEGDPLSAVSSFDRALSLDEAGSARVSTLLHRAELELDLKRPESATDFAHRALDLAGDASPTSAAAHHVLGKAAEAREDWSGAVESYGRALELQPSATRLHYLLGQVHRRAGDFDAAREHLRQAGQSDVAFADARLASIYTDVSGSAALMQRGASAKSVGMLEASVDIYRQAVANDPRSPEARRDLGALLAQTGRYRESADQYREAVRLEPKKALNHFVLALVLEQLDAEAEKEALVEMDTAVELSPGYREFRLALAERLATKGRFADALVHFERLVSDDPGDRAARLERAKVRLASGEAAGALEDARKVAAEAEQPMRRAEALGVVGEALARSADAQGAASAFRRALEFDPDLAGAHFGLANLAGMAGRFDDAVAAYRRAIDADPNRVAAWLGEATALALSGREAEAIERLETGRRTLGDPAPLTFTLARLLLAAQNPAPRDPGRAVELAESLLALSATPEHGELLAVALAAVGRFDEAVSMQKSLLKSMPAGSDPQLEARWRNQLQEWQRMGER